MRKGDVPPQSVECHCSNTVNPWPPQGIWLQEVHRMGGKLTGVEIQRFLLIAEYRFSLINGARPALRSGLSGL